jgi:hypothetical protein
MKMKFFSAIVLMSLCTGVVFGQRYQYPFLNPNLPIEARAARRNAKASPVLSTSSTCINDIFPSGHLVAASDSRAPTS